MNEIKDYILEELVSGRNYITTPINKILYKGKSEYQEILIAETPFGKTLFLDNILQFSEYDEEYYHKGVVIPAYLKKFRKILVLGGGDGGVARELLNLNNNLDITVVDIDPEVTRVVEKYVPNVINKVFEKKNVKLLNMDAFKFVEEDENKYHYIINDLTDLREYDKPGSQVNRFYENNFLKILKNKLYKDGRIVYHLEIYPHQVESIRKFVSEAMKIFRRAVTYCIYIPSFGGLWTFAVMTDSNNLRLKKRIYIRSIDSYINVIKFKI